MVCWPARDGVHGERTHGVPGAIEQAAPTPRAARRLARRRCGEADQEVLGAAEFPRRHRHGVSRRPACGTRARCAPASLRGRADRHVAFEVAESTARARPDRGPSTAASLNRHPQPQTGPAARRRRYARCGGRGFVDRRRSSRGNRALEEHRAVGGSGLEHQLRHRAAHAIAGHMRGRLPDKRDARLPSVARATCRTTAESARWRAAPARAATPPRGRVRLGDQRRAQRLVG